MLRHFDHGITVLVTIDHVKHISQSTG
jgi:hypothetical protein